MIQLSIMTKSDQAVYEETQHANFLFFQEKQQILPLAKDEIHIWCVPINKFLCQADMFLKSLSIDEKRRADRFYMERDRKRYIICRGILRSLISVYLAIEADKLQFCYGKFGKPALASDNAPSEFQFSMSHSDNMALYAFVREGEIGIDVERIRVIPEMEQIVEQLFSNIEKKIFNTLPQNRKQNFFFQIWTRKESLLKGLGKGFQKPSSLFDVLSKTPVMPDPMTGKMQRNKQWHIGEWSFSPDYAAAYSANITYNPCLYML